MKANTIARPRMGAVTRVSIALFLIASPSHLIEAAELERARVTKAVNVVNLLHESRAPRPAKPGILLTGSNALQTGDRSRAELQFADESVVRLGSNSIFGFKAGEREIDLQKGSLLLQIPKGRGTTKIKSLPITAAITGTTILFESSEPVRDSQGREIKPGIVKLIVVEGSLEWAFNDNPRKKLKMRSGDMVAFPSNARTFPKKVKVDLARIRSTSLLMEGGLGKLPDMERVNREISTQKRTSRDENNPTRGFLIKQPKPDTTDNRVREADAIGRSRPIERALTRIFRPTNREKREPAGSAPAQVEVVIPTRPDRCPQDSLDHLCKMPGFGAGASN